MWAWGPPATGQFFGKESYFNAIWITFCAFLEPLKKSKFLRFESALKKEQSLSRLAITCNFLEKNCFNTI